MDGDWRAPRSFTPGTAVYVTPGPSEAKLVALDCRAHRCVVVRVLETNWCILANWSDLAKCATNNLLPDVSALPTPTSCQCGEVREFFAYQFALDASLCGQAVPHAHPAREHDFLVLVPVMSTAVIPSAASSTEFMKTFTGFRRITAPVSTDEGLGLSGEALSEAAVSAYLQKGFLGDDTLAHVFKLTPADFEKALSAILMDSYSLSYDEAKGAIELMMPLATSKQMYFCEVGKYRGSLSLLAPLVLHAPAGGGVMMTSSGNAVVLRDTNAWSLKARDCMEAVRIGSVLASVDGGRDAYVRFIQDMFPPTAPTVATSSESGTASAATDDSTAFA